MSDHSQEPFEAHVYAVDPNDIEGGIKSVIHSFVLDKATDAANEILGAIDKDSYFRFEEEVFKFVNAQDQKVAHNVYLAASLAANMIATNPLGHPEPDPLALLVRTASFTRIVHRLVEETSKAVQAEAAKAAEGADGATKN